MPRPTTEASLIKRHPQQNEFWFQNLKFNSKFDSGNLADVKEINNKYVFLKLLNSFSNLTNFNLSDSLI